MTGPLHFDFTSALLGAIIGSVVTLLFRRAIHIWDLNNKKELMNSDLINQQDVLLEYKNEVEKLLKDFQTRSKLDSRSIPLMNLHMDIYNAVSKPDLFLIYHKKLPQIVKIYKSIAFLKDREPAMIYREFVNWWNEHQKSQEHLDYLKGGPNRPFCEDQLKKFELITGQLQSNLDTLDELKREINGVLKFKFYWLNPFNSLR